MTSSINFLLHLIGFGLISASIVGGWILERKIRTENDWNQKLYVGKISTRFGILSSLAALLMLLTGIVNIISLYNGNTHLWYTSGWLVAKIILFAFLLVNGAFFGPILIRRRTKLIKDIAEKSTPEDQEPNYTILNKSISTFYLVQFLLLLIILYLSAAGGGKHAGII